VWPWVSLRNRRPPLLVSASSIDAILFLTTSRDLMLNVRHHTSSCPTSYILREFRDTERRSKFLSIAFLVFGCLKRVFLLVEFGRPSLEMISGAR
jgi:hypothetical protein